MAGSSLFALIDDIASILDDVSVMTQVAAKKTAAVLGDDLALNAQQVSGVKADRELPVVWAVAKGSIVNKLILVPSALATNWIAPWAVMPLLMIGGAYLCFEGCEKLAHRLLHTKHEDKVHHQALIQAIADPAVDILAVEKSKIKGAIRTDFVLSAEIIVITLGVVASSPFLNQVMVLGGIATIMTVGVYGLVAGIVKLDDGGLYLSTLSGDAWTRRWMRAFGRSILISAPYMLKGISIVGTAAMFLVGGQILVHGIPGGEGLIHDLAHGAGQVAVVGGAFELLTPMLLNGIAGVVAGAVVLAGVLGVKRLFSRRH